MIPKEFIDLIKCRNPQELVMSMIKNNNINNPMISQLIECAQRGDNASVSKIAESYFNGQGKNFNNELQAFMSMLK